jgi:hypoxanthine phosphoribosyltransferase
VQGIVDTGLSTAFVVDQLNLRTPASVSVCTLVDKPARRLVPVHVHHVGLTAPDRFVVGYGLDFAGRYRNLPLLLTADAKALAADPDALARRLYVQR